ncbi:alpha/beta hydrolase [Pelagimonas sp. KU-00592-HH]
MMTTKSNDRPVLFLHGWTMRGSVFDPLVDALGPRAMAPDFPGHGDNTDHPTGLDSCVAQVDALIRATGREDVLLVGWSMGAAVAWSYIRDHGTARLSGLVTLDMSPRPANGSDWDLGLLGSTPERLAASTREIHEDWASAAEKIATTMFATREGAPAFSRDAALLQVLSNDPAIMAAYWDDLMALNLWDVVARVDVPWLVGYGERSRVYPEATALWMANTAQQAHAVGFAQSGHSANLEEPEAFLAALQAFEDGL